VTQPLIFKLDANRNGHGLRCDAGGLFLAGESLLERDVDDQFRPRPAATIKTIFRGAYGADGDWTSRVRSVEVVAKALNMGDMARAMMAAVLMRLPEPGGMIRIADVDTTLAKSGFDPDEPRDDYGRWTSGGGGDGKLIPVQLFGSAIAEPLFGQLIEQFPAKPVPMPYPTDIVPPAVVPRGLAREPASNPYPKRRRCVKEWADAEKYCRDLLNRGKLSSAHGNRGQGGNYDQCVRGRVSEECGGNAVEFEMIADTDAGGDNA